MRFCFTIRDLLWLTLVVALAVGWWLDHSKYASIVTFNRLPIAGGLMLPPL